MEENTDVCSKEIGYVYVGWIHLAPYTVKWRAIANTVLVLEIQYKAGESLTSSVTVSFWRTLMPLSWMLSNHLSTCANYGLLIDNYECDLHIKPRRVISRTECRFVYRTKTVRIMKMCWTGIGTALIWTKVWPLKDCRTFISVCKGLAQLGVMYICFPLDRATRIIERRLKSPKAQGCFLHCAVV